MNKTVKVLIVANIILLAIVTISMFAGNKKQEIDYELLSDMIAEKISEEQVDYERIKVIVKEAQDESIDNLEIEIREAIETKYEELDKDFGEKFEEMTSYFGDKFKELFNNINEKLNEWGEYIE